MPAISSIVSRTYGLPAAPCSVSGSKNRRNSTAAAIRLVSLSDASASTIEVNEAPTAAIRSRLLT
jgi:hypothetical protein